MSAPILQFKGNPTAFCDALDFQPDHYQVHFLKKAIAAGAGGARIGMACETVRYAETILASILYRALVDDVPTYIWFETQKTATLWLDAASLMVSTSKMALKHHLYIPPTKRSLNANGRHTCIQVGPFSDAPYKFIPGAQDILIPEIDWTPGDRIKRACKLTVGSILYLPVTA